MVPPARLRFTAYVMADPTGDRDDYAAAEDQIWKSHFAAPPSFFLL
jgi:hypothetical protein